MIRPGGTAEAVNYALTQQAISVLPRCESKSRDGPFHGMRSAGPVSALPTGFCTEIRREPRRALTRQTIRRRGACQADDAAGWVSVLRHIGSSWIFVVLRVLRAKPCDRTNSHGLVQGAHSAAPDGLGSSHNSGREKWSRYQHARGAWHCRPVWSAHQNQPRTVCVTNRDHNMHVFFTVPTAIPTQRRPVSPKSHDRLI
jgi:hypothetical protein